MEKNKHQALLIRKLLFKILFNRINTSSLCFPRIFSHFHQISPPDYVWLWVGQGPLYIFADFRTSTTTIAGMLVGWDAQAARQRQGLVGCPSSEAIVFN